MRGWREALGWTADDVVAVTFGSFGSQLRALRNCHEHLARGLRAGHLQRIVCVGGVNRTPPSELTAFGDHFGGPRRFQVLGHRPERTVAKVLECSDFAFSAYPRGLLGKSTAFSAFALAGLPVLVANAGSGEACDLDEPPFLRADSWDWSQANSPEVAVLREKIQGFAEANLAWPLIARKAPAPCNWPPSARRRPQRAWMRDGETVVVSDKLKILYIASSGRSGSTVLDLLLGAHAACWTLGEFYVLPWNLRMHTKPCGCGRPVEECHFWGPIVAEHQGALLQGSIDRFRDSYNGGRPIRFREYRFLGSSAAAHRQRRAHQLEQYGRDNVEVLDRVLQGALRYQGRPGSVAG